MKCNEARRLVRLYLDSELDAKTSLEVEKHIESCDECAGLFEAEKKFDARIYDALNQGGRTAALWAAAEAPIEPARPFFTWPKFAFATAAAAVALVAVVYFHASATSLELANAAGECHNAYVEGITSPEFTGDVPEKIAREFGNKLDKAAFSYRPAANGFATQGARFCHVDGVPVALIMGRYEETPVSIIVFKRSQLEHFPKTRERFESGHAVVCSRTGRYQFAARFLDGHVVCMVGEAPRPVLERLLNSVTHADG